MTPTDEGQAARAAFAAWASQQAAAPREPASLVTAVDRSAEYVGMLSTEIAGRRVGWKSVPANSRARISAPRIGIERIEAWDVEAVSLQQQSDHIAVCDLCAGQGRVSCASCGGIGKTTCKTCGGQRKMYGYAANGSRRLLNCTTCRGKGEVDCPDCRRGIATCHACAGEGRVQRWIELESWHRALASVHPEGLAQRFGWSATPPNDAIVRDGDVVADVERPHRLASTDLDPVLAQWLGVLAPPLATGERVARQRLRVVRLMMTTVGYRVGAQEYGAIFSGKRLLAPPADPTSAFARRAARLRALLVALLVGAALFAIFSLGRGFFYWSVPTLLSIGALVAPEPVQPPPPPPKPAPLLRDDFDSTLRGAGTGSLGTVRGGADAEKCEPE